jgi:hypothetical protein
MPLPNLDNHLPALVACMPAAPYNGKLPAWFPISLVSFLLPVAGERSVGCKRLISPPQEGLPRHGYFTFDGIPSRGFPVFDCEAFMAFAELTPRTLSHNLPPLYVFNETLLDWIYP